MRLVIAIPTRGRNGLDDVVDEVFARAPYFTIVEASEEEYRVREVIENEFKNLCHGVGPIIVKLLKDRGVNVIATPEIGCGVEELIRELCIKHHKVEPGARVKSVIESIISEA